MGKKNGHTSTDFSASLDEFEKLMQGVRPIKQDKISLTQATPLPKRHAWSQPEEESPTLFLSETHCDPVRADECLTYHHDSISAKILRKLSKGQYNTEARLDLHGMTIEQAKRETEQFLAICCEQGIRVVLIIHGKGRSFDRPILKNKLNAWLRNTEQVLAFTTAAKHQGGLGAACVLLKKTRDKI